MRTMYLLLQLALLELFQLCVADMLLGKETNNNAHEILMKHMSSTVESAKKPFEASSALYIEDKIDALSSDAFGGYIVAYFSYSGTTCGNIEAAGITPLGVCYLDSTFPNIYKLVTKTNEDSAFIYTSELTYSSTTGCSGTSTSSTGYYTKKCMAISSSSGYYKYSATFPSLAPGTYIGKYMNPDCSDPYPKKNWYSPGACLVGMSVSCVGSTATTNLYSGGVCSGTPTAIPAPTGVCTSQQRYECTVTASQTSVPTSSPAKPAVKPSVKPSSSPSAAPSKKPTQKPSAPTNKPATKPSPRPSSRPSTKPK